MSGGTVLLCVLGTVSYVFCVGPFFGVTAALQPWLALQRVVVLDVAPIPFERWDPRLVTYKRSVWFMVWRHSVAEVRHGKWTLRDGRELKNGWQRTHMTWAYNKWQRAGEERERAELMEGRIQEHTERLLASGDER